MESAPASASPPCSCPAAGCCERHRMQKSSHLHKLCVEREDYRRLWDRKAEGRQPPAPQQEKGKSRGLGDTVAKVIQVVTFGVVKPCRKCKKRQAKLNRLFPYDARSGDAESPQAAASVPDSQAAQEHPS